MTAALLALAFAQAPLGPTVPAGSNRAFAEAALNVQDRLQEGKKVEAKRASEALPNWKPRVWFDGAGLDAEQKTLFRAAVTRALRNWSNQLPEFEPQLVEAGPAQIKISFTSRLADTDFGWPHGAATMTSSDPGDAQVATTIGLVRGNPQQALLADEVHNETVYAVSQYFGFGDSLRVGASSWRTDLPGANKVTVLPLDGAGARKLLGYATEVRKLAEAGDKITAARPRLSLEHTSLELPNVVQGEDKVFDIQVANNGNAPLSMRVESECACYAPSGPTLLQPGQTGLIRVAVNSRDFVGNLKKKLRVISNDSDFPVREIPVSIVVKPQFRLLAETSPYEIPEEGGSTHLFLIVEEGAKWKPQEVRVDGFKNVSSIEPWEGEIADPEIGMAKTKKSGYRITVEFEAQRFTGRSLATCTVFTDSKDPMFASIRRNFEVMRGIYASPGEVFLGEIPAEPTTAFFFLSRPTKPFKILEVTSSSPFVKAEAKVFKGADEWRVVVKFDGKMDPGILEAILTIKTDDPKQPVIEIPVQGTVR